MITTGVLFALIVHGIRCLHYDMQNWRREKENEKKMKTRKKSSSN